MNIQCIKSNMYSFKGLSGEQNFQKRDDNPISEAGEKAALAKASFATGAFLGVRCLLELAEDGFIIEKIGDKTKKIVSKQSNLTSNERFVRQIGVFTGITALFVAGVAALYTLFKAPEINYQGNVNAFTKRKDMDIYIKGNSMEKELYTQMNEKAKNANADEKAKLREQYMQMRAAKNQLPDFLKQKNNEK